MEGFYGLIAFVTAWFIAQVSKTIIGLLNGHKAGKDASLGAMINYFSRSGGMPSGHTASFTALTLYFGLRFGFGSAIFALALCSLIIIVYDAMHVRYAVGIQGKALNELLEKAGKPELPIIEGHTPVQVCVGAIIGIIVGLGIFWLTGGFLG